MRKACPLCGRFRGLDLKLEDHERYSDLRRQGLTWKQIAQRENKTWRIVQNHAMLLAREYGKFPGKMRPCHNRDQPRDYIRIRERLDAGWALTRAGEAIGIKPNYIRQYWHRLRKKHEG